MTTEHRGGMYIADRVRVAEASIRMSVMDRITKQIEEIGGGREMDLTRPYGIALVKEVGVKGREITSVVLTGVTERDLNGQTVEMKQLCTQLAIRLPIDMVVQIPEEDKDETEDDRAYSVAMRESDPTPESRFFEAVLTPHINMATLTDGAGEKIETGQLLGDHTKMLRIIDSLLEKKKKAIGTGF